MNLVFSLRKYGVTPNFSEERKRTSEGALKKNGWRSRGIFLKLKKGRKNNCSLFRITFILYPHPIANVLYL